MWKANTKIEQNELSACQAECKLDYLHSNAVSVSHVVHVLSEATFMQAMQDMPSPPKNAEPMDLPDVEMRQPVSKRYCDEQFVYEFVFRYSLYGRFLCHTLDKKLPLKHKPQKPKCPQSIIYQTLDTYYFRLCLELV